MVESIDVDIKKYGPGVGWVIMLRTAIFDHWVSAFLAEHPADTVVELGTGLNTRFERVDPSLRDIYLRAIGAAA